LAYLDDKDFFKVKISELKVKKSPHQKKARPKGRALGSAKDIWRDRRNFISLIAENR
jgi:hypothetical protein